jgi:hypothetical protein
MPTEKTYQVKGEGYEYSVTAVDGIITRAGNPRLIGQPLSVLRRLPGLISVTLMEVEGRERES